MARFFRFVPTLLVCAGLLAPPAAAGTPTLPQWGVFRGGSPWQLCHYDATGVCQPVGALDTAGAGFQLAPSALTAGLGPFGFSTLAGVVGDGFTNVTATLSKAFAQGPVVKLPCGSFKIGSALTINIPAGQQSTLEGSGFCTVLAFQGAAGLTVNYGGAYSSLLFADMTMTTNGFGTAKALTLSQPEINPALSGTTTIRDVKWIGDDAGPSSLAVHYWDTAIQAVGVSNINVVNPIYFGGSPQHGKFMTVAGRSATNPSVLTNITNLVAYGCDTGITYGTNYQGMQLVAANITSCNVGVSILAGATNGADMLKISDGQIQPLVTGVACNSSTINNLDIHNLYVILYGIGGGKPNGIQACGAAFKVHHNQVEAPGLSGNGIEVVSASGIPGVIDDNTVAYATNGIFVDAGINSSTPIVILKDNLVTGSLALDYNVNADDTGILELDMMGRTYAKLPSCGAWDKGSVFLVLDGADDGTNAGGGTKPFNAFCSNGTWTH